jgi:hypothetical protein
MGKRMHANLVTLCNYVEWRIASLCNDSDLITPDLIHDPAILANPLRTDHDHIHLSNEISNSYTTLTPISRTSIEYQCTRNLRIRQLITRTLPQTPRPRFRHQHTKPNL